jgi:hypothetical protein
MSHTNRNFVIAYIVLVGLPLAGLAGVLRAGRSLKAPASVDGTWKLQRDASQSNPGPCTQVVASIFNSSLVISQSGNSVILTFPGTPKASGSGAIEGQILRGVLVPSDSSASDCAGDARVTLTATIDPKADPRMLTGVLSLDNCASCADTKFSAVRLPRTRSGEAR